MTDNEYHDLRARVKRAVFTECHSIYLNQDIVDIVDIVAEEFKGYNGGDEEVKTYIINKVASILFIIMNDESIKNAVFSEVWSRILEDIED